MLTDCLQAFGEYTRRARFESLHELHNDIKHPNISEHGLSLWERQPPHDLVGDCCHQFRFVLPKPVVFDFHITDLQQLLQYRVSY